ncbi:MAG: hypothetical protein P1Q69_06755 [Candidatus Thorarchaeota archaeon]|nr:hypothetical protein [Candidatus Thorarchaeota archaeon]
MAPGEYFESDAGVLYSWNPKADISYEEIEVKSGPLSPLRPIVENDRILNGKYILPKSADEVLDTELGEDLLMVATPNMHGYKEGWKKCWKIWFIIGRIGEKLNEIQDEFVTIQDIGVFFECMQIIDTITGKRYPTSIAFKKLSEVDLPPEVRERGRIQEFIALKEHFDELEKTTEIWRVTYAIQYK